MVYPMMVTLHVKSVFKGKDLKLQTVTQVINFIFVPLLAFFIGKLMLSGQDPKYGLWAVGLLTQTYGIKKYGRNSRHFQL